MLSNNVSNVSNAVNTVSKKRVAEQGEELIFSFSNNFIKNVVSKIACDIYSNTLSNRILGGALAASGEFPWMVRCSDNSILMNFSQFKWLVYSGCFRLSRSIIQNQFWLWRNSHIRWIHTHSCTLRQRYSSTSCSSIRQSKKCWMFHSSFDGFILFLLFFSFDKS